MKLSELAGLLVNFNAEYGDIEIVLNDQDTGWIFKLIPKRFEHNKIMERIEISVDSNDIIKD